MQDDQHAKHGALGAEQSRPRVEVKVRARGFAIGARIDHAHDANAVDLARLRTERLAMREARVGASTCMARTAKHHGCKTLGAAP